MKRGTALHEMEIRVGSALVSWLNMLDRLLRMAQRPCPVHYNWRELQPVPDPGVNFKCRTARILCRLGIEMLAPPLLAAFGFLAIGWIIAGFRPEPDLPRFRNR